MSNLAHHTQNQCQTQSLSREQLTLLKQFKQQLHQSPVQSLAQTQPKSNSDIRPFRNDSESLKEEDHQLFLHAMQGVRPLKQRNLASLSHIKPSHKVSAQMLAKRLAATGSVRQDHPILSDTQAKLHPVASHAVLSYRIATLQHRVFDELKAGKLRWFQAVDLHGATVEQAREAVLALLHLAKTEQHTVVKIVHGKGEQALLKTYVNGWLRQYPEVLAFVSAPESQGGTGAVLVLLKRHHQYANNHQA